MTQDVNRRVRTAEQLKLGMGRSGVVLLLKSTRHGGAGPGRVLRFTVADADNNGSVHFSARDRLVRALADSALAQLGLTLPVEETNEQQCREMFSSWNAMPPDYMDSFAAQRLSSAVAKPRTLDVVSRPLSALYVLSPGSLLRGAPDDRLVPSRLVPARQSRAPPTRQRARPRARPLLPVSRCPASSLLTPCPCLCGSAAARGMGWGRDDRRHGA